MHSANDGEVTFYEGQLSRKEITARDKAKAGGEEPKVQRPELTKPMQTYLDLHRHAAVRCELLSRQDIALRLAVAQMIAGSELWTVHADPQKADSEKITDSLEGNLGEAKFEEARQQIKTLLGFEAESGTLACCKQDWGKFRDLSEVFAKLTALDDKTVMQILTFVVAETLPCGSAMVDTLGVSMKVDMQDHWTPEPCFFNLLRDKDAINGMVAEVAGKEAAAEHITSTAKTQKAVIAACLDGTGFVAQIVMGIHCMNPA